MYKAAHFDFRHHGGFQQQFNDGDITPGSSVMVSICEVGNIGGQVTPFQGAASLSVDDVVPGNGNCIVRGNIGWGSDLDVRLHLIVVNGHG